MLDESSKILGKGAAAPAYRALSRIYEISSLLLDWGVAVRAAEADSERYLVAAKQRTVDLEQDIDQELLDLLPQLSEVLSSVKSIETPSDVPEAVSLATRIPLPLGVFRINPPQWSQRYSNVKCEESTTEVAIATFYVNQLPVANPQAVSPHVVHDLGVKIRLSGWPSAAEAVRLQFTTIERQEHYEVPEFQFAKPSGDPPFELEETGRLQLKVVQSPLSRPMEFHYSLHFLPETPSVHSSLEGQKTLHLEAVDPLSTGLTGYPELDGHFFSLRDELRRFRGPTETDRRNFLLAFRRLLQLAGRAKQDKLLGSLDEARFQEFIRGWLREDTAIGAELEEHPKSGGGITDLSFRGIRIELKVENGKVISFADTAAYVEQAAQYVSTSSKQLGLLVVLDGAPKTASLGATFEDIGLSITANGSICLGVAVIRGNLPRPSDL